MSVKLLLVGQGVLVDLVRKLLAEDTAIETVYRSHFDEISPTIDSFDSSDWCDSPDIHDSLDAHGTQNVAPALDTTMALVVEDGWNPQLHLQAEQTFRTMGVPWMRVFVALGQGIIGPFVRQDEPGCSQCADMRWMMAETDRNQVRQIRFELAVNGAVDSDAFSSRTGLHHLALLTVNEARRHLRECLGQEQEHENEQEHEQCFQDSGLCQNTGPHVKQKSRGTLLFVDMSTLAMSRHFFLPIGTCAVCGPSSDDGVAVDSLHAHSAQAESEKPDSAPSHSAQGTKIEVERHRKANSQSYRHLDLADLKEVLARDYLDVRSGLLNAKVQDLITPFAAVSTNLPITMGDEGTAGRSHSYSQSEMTAILEGLERYCGLEQRDKRPVIRASYADVSEKALNPRDVGLHNPEAYANPDFPFQSFDETLPMDWVWGYSLTEQRPIFVPKLFAFYSLGYGEGFVYETSNGCALGGSLGEAIFHGMLEVVERDAFLMTWYGRLQLPPVNAKSAGDEELDLMIARLELVTGYDIYLYNATMEHGIPSVFVVAKNRRETGMNVVCAAGSHVDGLRAVKGAIHEIAGMLLRFDDKIEAHRDRYLDMYRDSSQVKHMEDHSMLYGLKEAEHRLDFLLKSQAQEQSFAEAFHPHMQKQNDFLYQDIEDLLREFRKLHLNVIVVDQTSPEIRRNGLYCVKVIIPGMIPMTFGHSLVRLQGLDRVLKTPMLLGYTKKALLWDELNPYPHPFC